MKRWRTLLLMSMISWHIMATGQNSMNLQQLISYSIKNSPALQQSVLSEQEAGYKTREVISNGLPQIDAHSKLDNFISLPTQLLPGELMGAPGTDIEVQFGKKYNAEAGIQATQLLYSQSYISGIKTARESEKLSHISTIKTEEELIYQVAQLYYGLLNMQQQLNTLEANLSNLKEIERTTSLQVKNDFARGTDLKRIQVNITNLETTRSHLIDGRLYQTDILKVISGIPSDTTLMIDNHDINRVLYTKDPLLHQFHISNNTDYQLLKQQQAIQTQQLKGIYAEFLPTVAGYASMSYTAQRNSFDIFSSNCNWFDMQMIGAKITIPLFHGTDKHQRIQQQKLALNRTAIEINHRTNQLSAEYQYAINKLNTSKRALKTQVDNKALAAEVYQETQLLYQEGMTNITTLLSSEQEHRIAQNSYTTEQINVRLAELDLLKASGDIKQMIIK